MKNRFKLIFLTIAFWLLGTLCVSSQIDTICLTDKEYNTLLVKSNCSDIIKADSALLFDNSNTISFLYEKSLLKDELVRSKDAEIKLSDKQVKKYKRKVLTWKFLTIGVGALGLVSTTYFILN